MKHLAIIAGSRRHWQLRAALCLGGVALAATPHLVPAASLRALDSADASLSEAQSPEVAADNFPGSAFFFAEGAFAPAPQTGDTGRTANVMPLAKVAAAPALAFKGISALDRYRALNCLTTAIYYEAANEPEAGQRAVAQVVLNRVRHPAWPNTVCGVVYQGTERTDMKCQFTFSCDGAMARRPVADKWARARGVAMRALAGEVFAPAGMATHYHTLAVNPDWASSLNPVAVVGAHIFYALRGAKGTASAFSIRYGGYEAAIGPSAHAYMRPAQALAAAPGLPALPATDMPVMTSTANPAPAFAQPEHNTPPSGDRLPQSSIKAEYRNSGRPLI